MSIATGKGDYGSTSLFTGEKVSKSDIKVEAYGTGDELVSFLGWLKHDAKYFTDFIEWTQVKIYRLNAVLASSAEGEKNKCLDNFKEDKKYTLDSFLSELEKEYGKLDGFIIPSETPSASKADICRSICRRFERRVISLSAHEKIDKEILTFINRLSDVLFMIARVMAKREGGISHGFERKDT